MTRERPVLAGPDPEIDLVSARMDALAARPMGLLSTMLAEHLGGGGKRIRARLALGVGRLLGVPLEDRVTWAAAVELLHNATLIHDDLQDGDRVRRGRPSVWALHGAAQAINAGDLLLVLPFATVQASALPDPMKVELVGLLAEGAIRLVRGQSDELSHRRALVDAPTYDRIATDKTGGLFGIAVVGALRLGGISPALAARCGSTFHRLGLLFQLQDDVIDLYGDKGRGEIGRDLYEGKPSALLVEHLRRWPQDAEHIGGVLAHPDAASVSALAATLKERGTLDAVLARMEALVAEILSCPQLAAVPGLPGLTAGVVELVMAAVPSSLARAPK